jgi:hypothetical protein
MLRWPLYCWPSDTVGPSRSVPTAFVEAACLSFSRLNSNSWLLTEELPQRSPLTGTAHSLLYTRTTLSGAGAVFRAITRTSNTSFCRGSISLHNNGINKRVAVLLCPDCPACVVLSVAGLAQHCVACAADLHVHGTLSVSNQPTYHARYVHDAFTSSPASARRHVDATQFCRLLLRTLTPIRHQLS